MRLSTRIAYNTIIQVVSKVIATGLGLVAVAFMTRYLGQVGFGQYTTIFAFLSFFGIMADLGLTLVTVQMISQIGINQDKILGNLFSLRLVSAVIFLGLAPLVVFFFPYGLIIKIGVSIATLSFFFIALNQILVGLFQKNLRMDKVSIAEVVSRIVLVLAVIIAVKMGKGLIGIVIATVIASLINFLLHYIFSLKFTRLKLCFDFYIWKEIIQKSWPLALTIVFNLIYLRADILILSLIKSQAEVGIYGAAYKVIDVLITLPFMFAGIILPVLTFSWAEKNIVQFKKILQKSFDVMVVFALPLAIGTQVVAKPIMATVAGNEFIVSGPVLRILIMAASIVFLAVMFSHAIVAIDKQRKIISAYIFVAITALAGYFIFIPRYSYLGAAWVTIYSELAIAIASFYLIWKYTKFVPQVKVFLRSLGASIIMGIMLFFFSNWISISGINLLLALSLAMVFYFVALYLFKGLNKQDIIDLLNKKVNN